MGPKLQALRDRFPGIRVTLAPWGSVVVSFPDCWTPDDVRTVQEKVEEVCGAYAIKPYQFFKPGQKVSSRFCPGRQLRVVGYSDDGRVGCVAIPVGAVYYFLPHDLTLVEADLIPAYPVPVPVPPLHPRVSSPVRRTDTPSEALNEKNRELNARDKLLKDRREFRKWLGVA